MQSLTDIKYRMKGISQTRQITGAMETISVAKMRKAMERHDANLVYFDRIRTTINNIISHSRNTTHPYLTKKAQNKHAVFIVIASDKGLAGGYNHNILEAAAKSMQGFNDVHIFTVGHMAREFFERRKMQIDGEFMHVTIDPTFSDAMNIVGSIMPLFDMDLADEVFVAYSSMQKNSVVVPEIMQLLPISENALTANLTIEEHEEEYYKEIFYDPSPEVVLESLVPQYLAGVIFGCLIQSVAAEHSSRMLAMSSATKNADEILDKLSVTYNRARQERITSELTEIISASNKL